MRGGTAVSFGGRVVRDAYNLGVARRVVASPCPYGRQVSSGVASGFRVIGIHLVSQGLFNSIVL